MTERKSVSGCDCSFCESTRKEEWKNVWKDEWRNIRIIIMGALFLVFYLWLIHGGHQ